MSKEDTFVAIDGLRLVGIDVSGEGLRWSQPISYTSPAVLIDADGSRVYAANSVGEIEAFLLPDLQGANLSEGDEPSLESIWKIKRETRGTPTLMPLPGGGVAVAVRGQMFGLSPSGRSLWEQEFNGRPFDWALVGERLIFTLEGRDGPVWSIDRSGPVAWKAPIGGRLVIAGDHVLVYAADGICRLDPDTLSAERLVTLPSGSPSSGDIVALPDGGLLVAHQDAYDRRLIALNDDGTVRWQRSHSDILRGRQQFLTLGDRPFLVSENNATSSSGEIAVFAVDMNSAELARIFTGGSREFLPGFASAFGVGDGRMLINVGGGRLVMLDTQLALDAVSQVTSPQ